MPEIKIIKLDGGHAFGQEGRAMAASNESMEHVTNLDQYQLATTAVSYTHLTLPTMAVV